MHLTKILKPSLLIKVELGFKFKTKKIEALFQCFTSGKGFLGTGRSFLAYKYQRSFLRLAFEKTRAGKLYHFNLYEVKSFL